MQRKGVTTTKKKWGSEGRRDYRAAVCKGLI